MSNDKDKLDKITDTIDTLNEAVKDNKDLINAFIGDSGMSEEGTKEISIADMDELSEMRSTEDKVEIVAETKLDGVGDVGIMKNGDEIKIQLGEKTVVANDVPEDLSLKESEVDLNNGVLTVVIPRTGGMDSGVEEKDGDL